MIKKQILFSVGGLIVGVIISYAVFSNRESSFTDTPIRIGGFKYISPLLACGNSDGQQESDLKKIKDALNFSVQNNINNGKLSDASVYFRDMSSGHWVGVNEDELFWPASLMKVPTLIGVLKNIEDNPGILQAQILYKNIKDENDNEHFRAVARAENGKTYSAEQLIDLMIRYSDNNSTVALANVFTKEKLFDVYTDLGIPFPQEDGKLQNYMSPKTYSYFFRILYNAAYLNRKTSEYALDLLTKTDFNRGIVAGVPSDIKVAHKFGENNDAHGKQLHDCGIIFYTGHPYLLCVMTKGDDYEKMSAGIADISKTVYEQVVNDFK